VPVSSFFGGIQRFAGQRLGQARGAYQQLDKLTGGWLPGGGIASPLTRAKQEGERKMQTQYEEMLDRQSAGSDYVGKPGRFAGKGQIINALRAASVAGANPIGVALGNPADVNKISSYYRSFPDVTNEYDLNTNMFLRYLSGTGAEGLKIDPTVGRQIYTDIKQQEQKLSDPQRRENIISSPVNPEYMKQGLLSGRTPIYYGGSSEAISPQNMLLPTDKGERWQLEKSLGSYWAEPTDNGYTIKGERYNFGYAPVEKEGVRGASNIRAIPGSIADIGRNLVKQGFGTPFTYSLDVKPSGQVTVR
jgi:hypothetical protein